MQIPIAFRQGTEADKNFVLSSWLRALKKKRVGEFENTATGKRVIIEQGYFAAFMPHDLFFHRFRPLIESKIYPVSNILIAYNIADPDQICGYIAYRFIGKMSVMSFCYVKKDFRCMGIARSLFETAKSKTNVTTYHVPWLDSFFKREGIIFDPFFDLGDT